ncbi:phospholipase A-2-activating protein [Clavulina sp. PMI_390]|nr:phospholipase A-2-activating protein [Clavulina sp. PMI_390]
MVYRLSATLTGHTSDVRGVKAPTPNLVLSGSRDTKAIAWTREASSSHFNPSPLFQAGSRYVNAVTYLGPTSDSPDGFIVAGGQDTLINIFPVGSTQTEPSHTLLGHSENVCALDATAGGTIISGSWDKTARVWKNFDTKYVLKGHTQAVWAVVAIDDEQFLTGSADKTIQLWQGHKSVRTFSGHTDAVRGLVVLPDIGFASCSNDSEIHVWTLGGDVIYTLSGHTSFVYSLALLPSGDLVSSGEDRSVRIWKDGECSQVIVHPAISVWTVSTMPNGDIVSGSSDGIVRVFSDSEDRWADAEDLKKYDDTVAQQALPSQEIGDVKKADLPGPEALHQPGKKEGQVIMVKTTGGGVEAHQWSSGAWQKVGDVVDAVGQGRRQLYEGKEYDYVFDVDIQDGVPPLKLPYNVADNPYQAALKFLQANELPESYIDQVVKFIEQNTAGQQLGTGSGGYADPFTGASRYQASAGPAATGYGGATSYQDPFTGAGGYHGSAAPTTSAPQGGSYRDPFTGASGYHGASSVSAPTPSKPRAATNILPVRTTLPFKQANVPAMRTKLFEINDSLVSDPATSALALTSEETASINRILLAINEAPPDPASNAFVNLSKSDVLASLAVAARWPTAKRFPVLDLIRLIAAHAPAVLASPDVAEIFVSTLLDASEWNSQWPNPAPKTLETNALLTLRSFTNSYWLGGKGNMGDFITLNKNQWVAMGTILLKYLFVPARPGSYIHRLGSTLSTAAADPEAQYRAFVALGNLVRDRESSFYVYVNKARRTALQADSQVKIVSLSKKVSGKEERFSNVAAELSQLLTDAGKMT